MPASMPSSSLSRRPSYRRHLLEHWRRSLLSGPRQSSEGERGAQPQRTVVDGDIICRRRRGAVASAAAAPATEAARCVSAAVLQEDNDECWDAPVTSRDGL